MLRRWLARSPAITRRDADRLLDGDRRSHDDLVTLLAAAAGPASPRELAGERQAVAAFRREFRNGDVVPVRPARRPRRRAAAVAGLSALVFAAGGTAYAATTGHLPDAVERVVEGMFTGGDPTSAPPADPASPTGGAATPTAVGSTPGPGGGVPGGAGPGVDEGRLNGLCRAWEATRDNPHAKAISAEDLRVLATAAGGEERIEAFCDALLNRTPAPTAPPTPDKPGNPSPGNGRPTTPPGGGPTKGPKG